MEDVMLSPEDEDLLQEHKWVVYLGYARSLRPAVLLHHLVLARKYDGQQPCPDQPYAMHVNGNKLDNRRENLRFVNTR